MGLKDLNQIEEEQFRGNGRAETIRNIVVTHR